MTDDSVIEEAVKAMYKASFGFNPGAMEPDARAEWEALAEAAFAVFEKAHAVVEDEPPMCGIEHPFNGHVCSLREGHPAGHVCDYKRPAPHAPTDDEREALADALARRLIGNPKDLMLAEGTGALHVALSDSIRTVIEDVYADCGDSDPGVLSSNIGRRLAWDLPPAILASPVIRRIQAEALRKFRADLVGSQFVRYGIVLPDINEIVDDLDEAADRIERGETA